MNLRLLFFFLLLTFPVFGQTQSPARMRHFLQLTPSPAGAIPYGNNPAAGRYGRAGDDARIYYEVYGRGKPLVVLHGGVFGSTYEMGRLIDSLSKTYQIIAISTRGHGKSEIGRAPLTYDQKADDVFAVIQAVTADSVTVLGFSDGAYTGYQLASRYPAQVRKPIAGAGEQVPGLRKVVLDTQEASRLDPLYWLAATGPDAGARADSGVLDPTGGFLQSDDGQ